MSNVLSTDKKQQVIALGKLGWSLRRIEEATGVRRETASAYLKAAGVAVCLPGWGPRAPAKPAILTPDFFAPFSQKPDAPSACVPQKLHQAIFIQCNVTGDRKNNSPGTGFDASHPTDAKDRAGRPPPVAARRGRPRRAWAWPRCSDAPSCSLINFCPQVACWLCSSRSAGPVLEVENDSASQLETVLRLIKEAGAHVVAFQAEREARVPAVIRSAAALDDIGAAALSRNLRPFLSATKNYVQPGFPLFPAQGDLRASAVRSNLHVFV